MNLIPEKDETVAAPIVATVAPVAPVKPKPKPKTFKSVLVTVPAGYVMPLGEVITIPFNITVQFGARWHPEWVEPQIVVQAFRILSMGDSLCFSGDKALAFPIPDEAKSLAEAHGGYARARADDLTKMGLAIPAEREHMNDFIVRAATIQ